MSDVAELDTVVRLVRRKGGRLVNVGHGRDALSVGQAEAFIDTWRAYGDIGHVVSWPLAAASWLRPACRFGAGAPDVWVVAARAVGWSGFGNRLIATGWRAERTVAFSGLADARLPSLAGFEATEGLSGATEDGGTWSFLDSLLRTERWS